MSRILQSISIDYPQKLLEIIVEDIDEIQKGAVVLDTTVGNEEYGYIDIVAANETKRGMFFFLNSSNQEADFLRSLKCLQWVQENKGIFQKLYGEKIDFDYTPNILFLAPCFSPSMQKVLLNLKVGRIVLLKYNCFQDEDQTKIFLEKIADSLEEEKTEDTPQANDNRGQEVKPEKMKPFTSTTQQTDNQYPSNGSTTTTQRLQP